MRLTDCCNMYYKLTKDIMASVRSQLYFRFISNDCVNCYLCVVRMQTYRDIVNQAISDLSAIGPFLETSLEGEKQLDHIHHYINKYEQLLDDPRFGFYTVLCELTQIRTLLNSVVSDSISTSSSSSASRPRLNNVQAQNVDGATSPVVQAVAATDVLVVNHAIRHYRDYVILRDLRKLLHRLRTDIKQSTR